MIHRHLCAWLENSYMEITPLSYIRFLKLLAANSHKSMIHRLGMLYVSHRDPRRALDCAAHLSVLQMLISRNDESTDNALIRWIDADQNNLLIS